MATREFIFKNTGEALNNDVVLPGFPYILTDYSYHFWIRPKTKFWRFGIRLSKVEDIEFYHPEHRYKNPEFERKYIDIHFGVGDWDNKNWTNPNHLQLCQYNIPSEIHILSELNNYKELSLIEWRIQLNPQKNDLDVSFVVDSNNVTRFVKIPSEFKFFKVFAWADSTEFDIESQIEIFSLGNTFQNNSNLSAIKVGNIIFRSGDMFDDNILKNTGLVLLPASCDGSATSNILNRASELGIPYPDKNPPGMITYYSVSYQENLLAGYAYSVDNSHSSHQIIGDIAKRLATQTFHRNIGQESSKSINIPLFGTGAGGLSAITVAEIYDAKFNEKVSSLSVIVSIPSENVFRQICELFEGRFIALAPEENFSKPDIIIQFEREFNLEINRSSYKLNQTGSLVYLNLNNFKFNASKLLKYSQLEVLSLNNTDVENIEKIAELPKLHTLYLSSNYILSFSFLEALKKLHTLDISFNRLEEISFLQNLKGLKSLYLKGNKLRKIEPLKGLKKIEILDLSENNISNISPLSGLYKLRNLNLGHNTIHTILPLVQLQALNILDISNNKIDNINYVLELYNLRHLKAEKNPFTEPLQLILLENENHLPSIKNLLSRQAEKGNVELILPAKILLLGNHASGKSSLLGYILNNHLRNSTESTHIIKIEKFPKATAKIPDAIFFDFGGQDYYHGIYRAFLSSGSIYLILWNEEFNRNFQRRDRNGAFTQDFTVQYWLSQKTYLENEKYDGQIDPLLLIQSYSERDKRKSFYDPHISPAIENEFFVSLEQLTRETEKLPAKSLNGQALKYLKASIIELIKRKQVIRNEPVWYVNFLLYILNQNPTEGHVGKDIEDVLQHYAREEANALEFLKDDLDQLHKQGLILYYKSELPNTVWLNPALLAKYVHETLLNKKTLTEKAGTVPFADFSSYDVAIITLLRLQKVIFLHEFGASGQEYIIPNFLPLATDDSLTFDLFTFGLGQPIFTLKFKNFLPFGLINQIICFFGKQKDKKKFWRDQLLFTLEGRAKILIHLNFQTLEIKVFAHYLNQTDETVNALIKKYIFYGILGLYWDQELLDFPEYLKLQNGEIKKEDFPESHPLLEKILQYENLFQNIACQPVDLYLSIDDSHFIRYTDLCNEENTTTINSFEISEQGELTGVFTSIAIYPFQTFTNRILKRRKKVAISYSKKNLTLVNRFKDYLVPLFDDELIEHPWYCTELIAGTEWNEEIQKKFDEADIIFFMISEHLLATKYVKENEIKNAIDKWNMHKTPKIIPIILVHYHFARKGKYDLSKFTALPYTLKPVVDFPDQHVAWHTISESVRIMIEKDFDPGISNDVLTSELKDIYERIIDKKL